MVPVAAVPVTNTIVEAREASVPSGVKSATMKSAKSAMKRAGMKPATVESTAAVKPAAVESAAVESAAVESATSVKTPAPAMRASVGKVRLAESSSEEQSSCHSSQNPSYPGPDSIFAIMLH
jgi:hypothetical protein